ncbi:MAG: putative glycoside hydrolase family 15 protein [Gemmatimonadota bacterium]|nr:putative glycoside hydrolase family 15 protein [Gemmatimonadota bacterium]MDH3423711.1 putative glycoside hydrolase family 15 protein [Gemmatimonadota bacterium]
MQSALIARCPGVVRRLFWRGRPLWAATVVLVASCDVSSPTDTVDVGSPADSSDIGETGDGSEGARSVNFFVDASRGFDNWTSSPTPEEQAWMRQHYFRMQTYASYFDSRLEWYPNAWVYKDSYAIYDDSDVRTDHPEWILEDAYGNDLFIPYGCSGGTCPQYAADVGNPDFRRWWIDDLAETLEAGYLGVWVDDVNLEWRVGNGDGDHVLPMDPRTGTAMTLADWRRYFAEFMEEIRDAFPDIEIAHNIIWYAQPPDDPLMERQLRAADFINLERGATDSGIRGGNGTYGYETFLRFIDRIHEMGGQVVLDDDDSDTEAEWMYELATYFLIKSGDDMIGADGDRSRMNPDDFWEGYDVRMGDAPGGRYETNGLFRRDYSCGVVVLNQPDQPTRSLDLGESFLVLGSGGSSASSVTLDATRAAILVKPDCTP